MGSGEGVEEIKWRDLSEDDRRLEKRVDFFDAETYAICALLENDSESDLKMWEATGGSSY